MLIIPTAKNLELYFGGIFTYTAQPYMLHLWSLNDEQQNKLFQVRRGTILLIL